MKILPVLLTSEHPECLRVSLSQMKNIPDLTIFVDTWNEEYRKWVQDTYSDQFRVVVSDGISDGFPGRGKNLVLDYFLNSDYTHLIPVDGDDLLWAGAYEKISRIIERYPADFYHYEYTDFLYSRPWLPVSLTWTKHWFKGLYHTLVEHNAEWKISTELRLLQYNYDVDRIAIETKKSAEMKYVNDVYSLEDVHRNLRLKHESLLGNLRGYTINSRDLYLHVKHQEHVDQKKRPRFTADRSTNPDDDCILRTKTLLTTLNWTVDDEKILKKKLTTIKVNDIIGYDEKKRFIEQNYSDCKIDYHFYTDILLENYFRDYDVTSEEDIETFLKEKIQLSR